MPPARESDSLFPCAWIVFPRTRFALVLLCHYFSKIENVNAIYYFSQFEMSNIIPLSIYNRFRCQTGCIQSHIDRCSTILYFSVIKKTRGQNETFVTFSQSLTRAFYRFFCLNTFRNCFQKYITQRVFLPSIDSQTHRDELYYPRYYSSNEWPRSENNQR